MPPSSAGLISAIVGLELTGGQMLDSTSTTRPRPSRSQNLIGRIRKMMIGISVCKGRRSHGWFFVPSVATALLNVDS